MSSFIKLLSLVVVAFVVVAPSATRLSEAALTCSQVTSSLTPCISYLTSGGGTVPPSCCGGIKNLAASAKTTADRQAACQCMKDAARGLTGIKPGLVTGLPGKCGVNIPYQISPTTDCKKIN